MIQIPDKLKERGIRFVLLERGGKKPFQKDWQNKTIEYDNKELLNHISSNGNYGVMGGGIKQLVILDFDDKKVEEEVCKLLPKTFTTKTGSGGLHKYFFSDNSKSFKIFNENMDTLVDIQGEGKQVVGADSIHPNGNKYEVIDDSEIAFLPYSEIQAILNPYDKKLKKEEKIFEKPRIDIEDDFLETIKNQVSMKDVLDSFGIDTSKNPTECYFHSSKGGKCLGFKQEVAHCFNCEDSWNIFSFVKQAKNCSFKEALEYLANLVGLQDELELSRKRYVEKLKEETKDIKLELKSKFLDYIKDKKIANASELLVDYILDNYYIYTTKDDIKSEIWIYEDGIYSSNGRCHIKKIMDDILGKWFSSYYFNQVINKIEPRTYINPKEFFGNNYVYEIPLKNGILNILTRELKEFTPEKIFFNKLNVEYNSTYDCPQIEKFLRDILSKEDDIDLFYELGGFCLMKEYKFEKAFMFVGDGRNGKDKSLELIKRLIGIENCCSVPLSSIIPDSFIISEFFGKMINIAGDINNKDLKDTSIFKALTGRSLMSAPRKFLNPITFVNYAKFIFACNELPMVYDSSRGFWDRWVLLEFPYTFVTKDEIEKDKNNKFLKLRDENIIEKITTEEELSGLLNKFLDGLDRLLVQKDFSTTMGSNEIKKLWIRKSNSVMAFCVDMIEDDYDSFITKKEFRQKYTKYCKKHKIKIKSDYVIKRTLEEEYGVVEESKGLGNGTWVRCWGGVKWK